MKPVQPFFSVVIPTYNRPVELKRAVLSVLGQTFLDFEIIVVNNGNASIQDIPSDVRLKVIQEGKKGAGYARNTGIKQAGGKFVCFLDDDDEYLPCHLQELHDLIRKNNEQVGLYKTFARLEAKDLSTRDQDDPLKPAGMHNLHYIFLHPMYMNCVAIHSDILKNHLFDPEVRVAQDYDLWIRILAEYKLFISPVVTNIYHFSSDSTSRPSKEKYFLYIKLYNRYFRDPRYGKFIPEHIKNDRIFRYYFWLFSEFRKELSLFEYLSVIICLIYYKPAFLLGGK